jgi:hypothetical protein
MSKNSIVGTLQGGLGNQLFILAAAWEQARRLGCDLYIDTHVYGSGYDREVEIDLLEFPGVLSSSARESSKFGLSRLVGKNVPNIFKERGFEFDERINQISAGTTLVGYFQSEKYFPNVGSEIAASIRKASEIGLHSDVVEDFSRRDFIAMHVRRGDYVSNPEATAVHGLTSLDYYRVALNLSQGLYPGLEVVVFSDSPGAVQNELKEFTGLIFDTPLATLSSLETLRVMSLAKCVITSNSTFSWWAGWLNNRLGGRAHVIAPRPWFENDYNTNDLLPKHWITIGK